MSQNFEFYLKKKKKHKINILTVLPQKLKTNQKT